MAKVESLFKLFDQKQQSFSDDIEKKRAPEPPPSPPRALLPPLPASASDGPVDDCADLLGSISVSPNAEDGHGQRKQQVKEALIAAMKRKDRDAIKRLTALQRHQRVEEAEAAAELDGRVESAQKLAQLSEEERRAAAEAAKKLREELAHREEMVAQEVEEGLWLRNDAEGANGGAAGLARAREGCAGVFAKRATALEEAEGVGDISYQLVLTKDGRATFLAHKDVQSEAFDQRSVRKGRYEVGAGSNAGALSLRFTDSANVYGAKLVGAPPTRIVRIQGVTWPYYHQGGFSLELAERAEGNSGQRDGAAALGEVSEEESESGSEVLSDAD